MKIFVSYKREDGHWAALLMLPHLEERFGAQNVFYDVKSIPLGSTFAEVIEEKASAADVMFLLVTPAWLASIKAKGDWCRREAETALRSGCTVIPLVVDGASYPTKADLPPSLRGLAGRNGHPLRRDHDFAADMKRILDLLEDPRPPAILAELRAPQFTPWLPKIEKTAAESFRQRETVLVEADGSPDRWGATTGRFINGVRDAMQRLPRADDGSWALAISAPWQVAWELGRNLQGRSGARVWQAPAQGGSLYESLLLDETVLRPPLPEEPLFKCEHFSLGQGPQGGIFLNVGTRPWLPAGLNNAGNRGVGRALVLHGPPKGIPEQRQSMEQALAEMSAHVTNFVRDIPMSEPVLVYGNPPVGLAVGLGSLLGVVRRYDLMREFRGADGVESYVPVQPP